jgi:hypothetical protein
MSWVVEPSTMPPPPAAGWTAAPAAPARPALTGWYVLTAPTGTHRLGFPHVLGAGFGAGFPYVLPARIGGTP